MGGSGADGLSSSAYGPEEAFRALGQHAYLAVFIALMIAATVLIISACYSKVIELFPGGGGGYLVATKLLGPRVGVVSGCALIVDYVLTISTSVASGVDQIFSLLPETWTANRFTAKLIVLGVLILLNMRGIKESVQILAPIFLVFLVSHALMIVAAIAQHFLEIPSIASNAIGDAHGTASQIGFVATLFIMLRAYSSAAAPTPASRPSRTGSRSCASRGCRTPRGPCSTWRHRLRSPPAASCSHTC